MEALGEFNRCTVYSIEEKEKVMALKKRLVKAQEAEESDDELIDQLATEIAKCFKGIVSITGQLYSQCL